MIGLFFGAGLSIGLQGAENEITRLTFQLDWHFNVQFAGLLVAQERGWYREAGLEVTFIPADTEMKVVRAVVEHTNWLGCSESGVLLDERAKGRPVKAIGTMLQGSPMCLMGLKTNGYHNVRSLEGKTIGTHLDGIRAFDFILARERLDRSKFRVIYKEHTVKPLIDGTCDAIQGYLIDEAVELEVLGHALNIIPYYDYGYPAYSQVYYTSEETLKANGKALQSFLQVSRAGWQTALLEPSESVRLVIEKYNPKLNVEYQMRSLQRIARLSTLETGFGRLGTMDRKTWTRMVDCFHDLDPTTRRIPVEEIADFSLVNPMVTWPPIQSIRNDFHQPGGFYPDATLPTRLIQSTPPRPLDMVVSVDPDGKPTTVMMVKESPAMDLDNWWIQQVVSGWKWPAGGWRKFRIDVPVGPPEP